jgi:hypothetical protein
MKQRALGRLLKILVSGTKFSDLAFRSWRTLPKDLGESAGSNSFWYLTVAQASTLEVQRHLYIARDLGYLAQPAFQSLYSQAETAGGK